MQLTYPDLAREMNMTPAEVEALYDLLGKQQKGAELDAMLAGRQQQWKEYQTTLDARRRVNQTGKWQSMMTMEGSDVRTTAQVTHPPTARSDQALLQTRSRASRGSLCHGGRAEKAEAAPSPRIRHRRTGLSGRRLRLSTYRRAGKGVS